MAEFCEVMRQWRRMCRAFTEQGAEDARGCVASGCPLGHSDVCGDIEAADDADFAKAETDIMRWAAEHPEPVYPTWKEWLEEQRIVTHFDFVSDKGTIVKWELTNKSNCPIPDDIAEKLGIEPKEG